MNESLFALFFQLFGFWFSIRTLLKEKNTVLISKNTVTIFGTLTFLWFLLLPWLFKFSLINLFFLAMGTGFSISVFFHFYCKKLKSDLENNILMFAENLLLEVRLGSSLSYGIEKCMSQLPFKTANLFAILLQNVSFSQHKRLEKKQFDGINLEFFEFLKELFDENSQISSRLNAFLECRKIEILIRRRSGQKSLQAKIQGVFRE